MNVLSWLGFREGDRRGRRRPIQRGRAKPRVEQLEDRQLLSATIAGFVFHDANDNGLFDPGEIPLASSVIQLRNAAGAVVGQTVSDTNGHYQFSTDQTAGTVPATVEETAHFGGGKTDWAQTQSVAQFDPGLGTLTGVDIISSGSLTSQIKFENLDSGPAMVTGTVSGDLTLAGAGLTDLVTTASTTENFQASAFDGVIDFAGTSGHDFGPKSAGGSKSESLTTPSDLARFTGTGSVSLTETAHATSTATGAGNLITQINSSAIGTVQVVYHYIPSNALKPGNYTIVQITEPPGYIDGKDSQNGVVIPNSIGTDTIPVTLVNSAGPGQVPTTNTQSLNNDFGEVLPASVAGFVYVDLNNSGVRVPGDPGLAGVVLTLTGTNDAGSAVSASTRTAADGSYSFAGLRPGSYTITETQPAGFLEGKDTLGNLGGIAGNDQLSLTLRSGNAGTNYNFAELPAPQVTVQAIPDVPLSKRMFLASTFRR
jgi:hypothetical protein